MVEEWAFDSAKELVRNDGEVTELEAAALEAVGVDPAVHATWPIHRGGCDGVAGHSCDARIAERAAQRFEEQEAARHERRERARADGELIMSGAFRVGQHVLTYYDGRAAVVTKINRVTIKVKHVGGHADRFQLVEKNYSPTYLHPLPGPSLRAAEARSSGQPVQFLDWGRRPRAGEILQVDDGPLLLVRYQLASGQARTAWIDVLRLDGART